MDSKNNTTIQDSQGFQVHWGLWSVLIVFGFFITIANVCICVMYIVWEQLRTPTNTFLIMLAIADLMVGALFIPLYIGGHYIEYYTSVNFTGNMDIVIIFTCFASVFNLYAVTLDRYIAVLYALRYNALMTSRNIRCIVAAAWILPACITLVLIFFKYIAPDASVFVLFGMETVFVIVPAFVTSAVYVKIFKEARRQIRQVAALEVSKDHRLARAKARRKEHKVAHTCVLLLVMFIICWLPTYVEQMMEMVMCDISPKFSDIAMVLMVFNSLINPILYGLYKEDFRSKLKRTFKLQSQTSNESCISASRRIDPSNTLRIPEQELQNTSQSTLSLNTKC